MCYLVSSCLKSKDSHCLNYVSLKEGSFMECMESLLLGQGEMEERKLTTIFIVVRCGDAPDKPPIPRVPPCVSPSPVFHQANLRRPHPSGKGRGGCSETGVSEQRIS